MIYEAWLAKMDVPAGLISMTAKELSEEQGNNVLKTLSLLRMGTQVVFLVGNEGRKKDMVVVTTIRALIKNPHPGIVRNIHYLNHSKIEELRDAPYRLTIIPNASLIPAKYIPQVTAYIFEALQKGFFLIICCDSLDDFERVYKEELFKYIADRAVAVSCHSELSKIITI